MRCLTRLLASGRGQVLFYQERGAGHRLIILVVYLIGMKIMIEVEIARLQAC
jgi:hypothetical protein